MGETAVSSSRSGSSTVVSGLIGPRVRFALCEPFENGTPAPIGADQFLAARLSPSELDVVGCVESLAVVGNMGKVIQFERSTVRACSEIQFQYFPSVPRSQSLSRLAPIAFARLKKVIEGGDVYELETVGRGVVVGYEGDRPVETAISGVTRVGNHSKYGFGELRVKPIIPDETYIKKRIEDPKSVH